jgi:hypothetical protein
VQIINKHFRAVYLSELSEEFLDLVEGEEAGFAVAGSGEGHGEAAQRPAASRSRVGAEGDVPPAVPALVCLVVPAT